MKEKKILLKVLCMGKEFRYQAVNSGKILAIYHMDDLQVQYIIISASQDFIVYPIISYWIASPYLTLHCCVTDALLAGAINNLCHLRKVT